MREPGLEELPDPKTMQPNPTALPQKVHGGDGPSPASAAPRPPKK